jgi:hypothetical protein
MKDKYDIVLLQSEPNNVGMTRVEGIVIDGEELPGVVDIDVEARPGLTQFYVRAQFFASSFRTMTRAQFERLRIARELNIAGQSS